MIQMINAYLGGASVTDKLIALMEATKAAVRITFDNTSTTTGNKIIWIRLGFYFRKCECTKHCCSDEFGCN